MARTWQTAALLGTMIVLAGMRTSPALAQTGGATPYTVLHRFTGSPTDGSNPYWGGLIRDPEGNFYGTTVFGAGRPGVCGSYPDGCGVVFKLDMTGAYRVLYSFTGGTDGAFPYGGLIRDLAGNLYGTTAFGGSAMGNSGNGVVFKLDTAGTETVLYSFTGGADGAHSYYGLARDLAGNLYGTTAFGGGGTCPPYDGCGVVFKLGSAGTETVLYRFLGAVDGGIPWAGVLLDAAGNLYGSTNLGGASGYGAVFKVDTSGAETVLHSFAGGADGADPETGLIQDSDGNLYGTAGKAIFRLNAAGAYKVLYSFAGGADGEAPYAALIRDAAGNLYGTTEGGGSGNCHAGCGAVFKLDAAGAETVLYRFAGGAAGSHPCAGLIRDSAGNLYGTTYNGGKEHNGLSTGLVFKLKPD
jgi:uncharacterized repeat protein (TIGR03803 family)